MKFLPLLSLILPLSFTALLAQPAAEPEKPAAKEELSDNQKAFLNLPEEQRKEFIKHFQEANRLFQAKRIFETLDEIDKAQKVFKDAWELYNIKGSCYVEMRNFDKAMAEFQEGRKISPNNVSVEFNIAEVLFVTRQWQKSLDALESVMRIMPPSNITLGRLVEFKIMLCKLKLDQKNEAIALAGKYDYLDESPYHYFAQAALAYEKNDLVKAEEWLAMSARIFRDPNILAPWQDTLVEYGYIPSFYGDQVDPTQVSPNLPPAGQ